MNLPRLSLSDWFQKRSDFDKFQIAMFMKFLPSALAFVYLVIGSKGMMLKTQQDWVNLIAGPAVVWTIGTMLLLKIDEHNKDEAQQNNPMIMDMWFGPTRQFESAIITDSAEILREHDLVKINEAELTKMSILVKHDPEYKERFKPELIPMLRKIKEGYENRLHVGRFFYHRRLKLPIKDDRDNVIDNVILLSSFPMSQIERRVDGQWLFHNTTPMSIPTPRLSCTWVNEFLELGEHYAVFLVDKSPQHVYMTQMGMGVTFDTVNPEHVAEAAQLTINHVATPLAFQLREEKESVKALADHDVVAEERSSGGWKFWAERNRFIREISMRWVFDKIPWWGKALIIGAAIYLIYYYITYVRK